ncbi:MAG: ParB/RepB/Spo0J family partition protein [Hahellaceae bacterium]|nr:ParB/RepB/Spo0J family partition protein [Hahellaceae bacterium]
MKKRGLGDRGLNALLSGARAKSIEEEPTGSDLFESDNTLKELPVDLIQRGKYQPRRDMHAEALEELAESIRQQGIIQPIVVRPVSNGRYEIIAGERRWRASQLAGIDRIPVVIRDVSDESAIAMALIENIQREDLNPVEEAIALKRLQDEFGLTQQKVADAVGKSRTAVTNLLRLLNLSDEVKTMLEHGDIEMGHARALLSLDSVKQSQIASLIVSKGLSVRQTEALVKKTLETPVENVGIRKIDPNINRLQDDLSERLGANVQIDHQSKGKGRLIIQYTSLDELDGILAHIH